MVERPGLVSSSGSKPKTVLKKSLFCNKKILTVKPYT
jgi:hypothetical protein